MEPLIQNNKIIGLATIIDIVNKKTIVRNFVVTTINRLAFFHIVTLIHLLIEYVLLSNIDRG